VLDEVVTSAPLKGAGLADDRSQSRPPPSPPPLRASSGEGDRRSRLGPAVQTLWIGLGALALLWPALANGFPLVFNDSRWYLAPLFGLPAFAGRPSGYTLFLKAVLSFSPSLWSVILVQSVLTSWLLVRVAVVAFGSRRGRLAVGGLGLAAVLGLSGGAKYVCWLMPDVFTAWLFLAGALFLLSDRWLDRGLAVAVTLLSASSHNAHVPLAVASIAVVLVVAGGFERGRLPRVLAALVVVVLGAPLASLLGHLVVLGKTDVMRGTAPCIANRFVDSGVFVRTLDTYCPERTWAACRYRPWFVEREGKADDLFLFELKSPFVTAMGAWNGAETGEIVRAAFRCCGLQIATTTLVGTWEQFWRIDTADGVDQRRTETMQKLLVRTPNALEELTASDQASGRPVRMRLHGLPENALQAALLVAGAAISAVAWRRGDRRPAWLVGGLLVFLVANAGISAFGSTAHDRYQGRVAWLLPFVVMVAAVRVAADAGRRGEAAVRVTPPRDA